MRYDQFMRFGWKVLIPVNLVWILFLAGIRVTNDRLDRGEKWLVIGGVVIAVLVIAMLWPSTRKPRQLSLEEQIAARPPGSFPVPPIDLQVPPSPRARRAVAERAPATVGGESSPEKEV
jgi:NADH-quinone oxidoreductase subunit H